MATATHGNGVENDVAATLDRALEKLREQREEAMRQFDFREQMIQQAREGLTMAFGEIHFPSTPPQESSDEEPVKLSISEKHLKSIEHYLAEHQKVRQADLVAKLSLNSGTVSVGLRRLEMAGLIKKAPKERGSRVWEHTAPEDTKRREMVLTAGEGAREGRVVS